MIKKQRYKWTILTSILLGTIGIIVLFLLNMPQINLTLLTVDGIQELVFITAIKTAIIAIMAFFLFKKWFNQEAQYLSDIPFLFGIFFLILVFGKLLDIIIAFNYYILNPEAVLLLIKIRYILLIIDLLFVLYLAVGMILYYLSLKDRFEKYKDEKALDKARNKILIIILALEIIAVILSQTYSTILFLLPLIVVPSVLVLIWLFAFAYKNQRLSQVHPLILAIGFGTLLASQISRPMAQRLITDIAMYATFSEMFELIVFIIIFIGLLMKANYKTQV